MSMNKLACLSLTVTILGGMIVSSCATNTTSCPQSPQPNTTTAEQSPATDINIAPVCVPNPACAPPDIHDTEPGDTYCVKKFPYQNFSVEPGAMVEPVEPSSGLKCNNSGTIDNDGKIVWTCTGQQLFSYQIKITNPACQTRILLPNSGRCQESFGYDPDQNCCAPFDANDSGYIIIKVNMGACP